MLHSLRPASGSRKARKRVARGSSHGGGTTAGRGTKGQQSRTGKGRRFGFEGGQVPLIRRQPKLGGFKPIARIEYEVLTLASLEKKLPAGSYSLSDLIAKRIVRNGHHVKLLATGSVTKKFQIEAHAASKAARKAVQDAGGAVTIVQAE